MDIRCINFKKCMEQFIYIIFMMFIFSTIMISILGSVIELFQVSPNTNRLDHINNTNMNMSIIHHQNDSIINNTRIANNNNDYDIMSLVKSTFSITWIIILLVYILQFLQLTLQGLQSISGRILMGFHETLIVPGVRMCYLYAPFFGWKGASNIDICNQLTKVPSEHWNHNLIVCDKQIHKEIFSYAILVDMILLTFAIYYIYFKSTRKRMVIPSTKSKVN